MGGVLPPRPPRLSADSLLVPPSRHGLTTVMVMLRNRITAATPTEAPTPTTAALVPPITNTTAATPTSRVTPTNRDTATTTLPTDTGLNSEPARIAGHAAAPDNSARSFIAGMTRNLWKNEHAAHARLRAIKLTP